MWVIEAALFVLSSGLLFSERFRANGLMVGIAALIAIVSSYFLFEEVARRVAREVLAERQAPPPAMKSAGASSPPVAAAPAVVSRPTAPEPEICSTPYTDPDFCPPSQRCWVVRCLKVKDCRRISPIAVYAQDAYGRYVHPPMCNDPQERGANRVANPEGWRAMKATVRVVPR